LLVFVKRLRKRMSRRIGRQHGVESLLIEHVPVLMFPSNHTHRPPDGRARGTAPRGLTTLEDSDFDETTHFS
jgi:hypothetical protein